MVIIKYTGEKSSGSMPVYTYNLTCELSKIIEIEVLSASSGLFSNIENVKIQEREQAPTKGIYTRFINMVKHWSYVNRKYKYDDIIIAVNPFEAVPFPKFKQIIVIHDLIPLLFPVEYQYTSKYYKYILAIAIRNSCHMVAVSENTKKDIVKFYGISEDKISVIYNGIGNKFEQGCWHDGHHILSKINGDYILYVGGQSYHKNLLRLLKAYREISNLRMEKMVIAGESNQKTFNELIDYCNDSLLADKVIFLGSVSEGELSALYQNARLFVLPSKYEGFGLTPLEAMYHKVPVMASGISSIPEICGNAAHYFDPDNTDQMACVMMEMLTNERMRDDFIAKGGSRINMFSWTNTANDFHKLLNTLS